MCYFCCSQSTIKYSFKVVGGGTTERFIPSQNIFLQDHGFTTGEKLIYSSDGDTTLKVSNGIGQTFNLTNNSPVFAIRGGRDLLGISTNPLGIISLRTGLDLNKLKIILII